MAQNKVNILEKKIPYPLSIRRGVVIEFDKHCADFGIDRNTVAESLFKEYLKELKHEDYDPTK